jgi:hypothetical protein
MGTEVYTNVWQMIIMTRNTAAQTIWQLQNICNRNGYRSIYKCMTIHLYIPLYPFLLPIFWSCHIVCTAVFRVIIIICHTFVYTSVPILVTHILELSYSLYGCISCHYNHLSHICIYLCSHSCYTYSVQRYIQMYDRW